MNLIGIGEPGAGGSPQARQRAIAQTADRVQPDPQFCPGVELVDVLSAWPGGAGKPHPQPLRRNEHARGDLNPALESRL